MSTSLPPQGSTTSASPNSGRRFFTRSPNAGANAAAKAVAEDASRLVRANIELAKAEARAAVQAKATGGGLLVVTAVAGWLALQGLLIAIGLLLALVLPGWAAALIVSGVLLLVAAITGLLARRRLKTPLSLEITKQSVEEDMAWAKAHLPKR